MKYIFYKFFIFLLALVLVVLCASPGYSINYYVDGINGNNTNSGLSSALAKQTIQAASNLTNPGDTVLIMNGTYLSAPNNGMYILNITRSGAAGQYVTYKAMKGHTPKLALSTTVTYQVWGAILVDASYIVIDGLEIEGNNASLTYDAAYQLWQNYENNNKDWVALSIYNAGGITVGKNVQVSYDIVRNCRIHDAGGGVGGTKCDYVTIENNTIYNNCWYSMYAGSGISILDPTSIDAVTTYKVFIRNNIVYNNKTLIPWERIDALSDGNGIILDVNTGYVGRYLVENNISYNNGGGGIHAYKASHVDIINNTAYNNGTVVGYPEMDANNCSDVKIYNNIMVARTGATCNGNDNATYDYNLYYNGTAYKQGTHDITGDPQFVNLAKDGTADFRLKTNSPAINAGSTTAGQYSTKDILGVARPVGFSTDMGAYEYPTVVPRPEINIKQGTTDIPDNTGSFDFGDVPFASPKTITFTIENIGDLFLSLTGTPKVVATGNGFSVATDAPASVNANGSATFQIKLTTSTTGLYTGTVSIANDDLTENPYNFSLSGYGYDGTKTLQSINFPALPVKVLGDADFSPGATASTGLSVSYVSSNAAVATITVDSKIHIVGAGASTIIASQAGDANTNVAKAVTQILTVTPVLPAAGTNLISNPTFDANTTGWSFAFKNSATASVVSVAQTGFSGNAGKAIVTSQGSPAGTWNVQLSTNVFVVQDRKYLVSFKASADAARTIDLAFLLNASPYTTIFSQSPIALTTSPQTYGPYAFTSTYTGYIAYRFLLGSAVIPAYFDDVEIVEVVDSPEISIKQGTLEIPDNTGSYSFGDVEKNLEKTVSFIIENRGAVPLTLTGSPNVVVTGTGFSLVSDAVSPVMSGSSTAFQVKFTPATTGLMNGTISITNNDPDENPYNFSISGTGIISTGIGDIRIDDKIKVEVYPNPASHTLKVSLPATVGEKVEIRMIDLNGRCRLIYNYVATNDGRNVVDLGISSVRSGTYLIITSTRNGLSKTNKVVVKNY